LRAITVQIHLVDELIKLLQVTLIEKKEKVLYQQPLQITHSPEYLEKLFERSWKKKHHVNIK